MSINRVKSKMEPRVGIRAGHRQSARLCSVDFGSHSSVSEDSSVLISYALSSGKSLTIFRRCVVPSPSGSSNCNCLIRNIKTFQSFATSVRFTSRHGITLQKISVLVCFVVRSVNEVGCGHVDWIGLAQDRDGWRRLVSAVMNLRVP
jgi:hypothetical protein